MYVRVWVCKAKCECAIMCVCVSELEGTEGSEKHLHTALPCATRQILWKRACCSNTHKCAKPEQWHKYPAEINGTPWQAVRKMKANIWLIVIQPCQDIRCLSRAGCHAAVLFVRSCSAVLAAMRPPMRPEDHVSGSLSTIHKQAYLAVQFLFSPSTSPKKLPLDTIAYYSDWKTQIIWKSNMRNMAQNGSWKGAKDRSYKNKYMTDNMTKWHTQHCSIQSHLIFFKNWHLKVIFLFWSSARALSWRQNSKLSLNRTCGKARKRSLNLIQNAVDPSTTAAWASVGRKMTAGDLCQSKGFLLMKVVTHLIEGPLASIKSLHTDRRPEAIQRDSARLN